MFINYKHNFFIVIIFIMSTSSYGKLSISELIVYNSASDASANLTFDTNSDGNFAMNTGLNVGPDTGGNTNTINGHTTINTSNNDIDGSLIINMPHAGSKIVFPKNFPDASDPQTSPPTFISSTFYNPSTGLGIYWYGLNNGQGETDLISYGQGGQGGFTFFSTPQVSTNQPDTTLTQIANLYPGGSTIFGNLTISGKDNGIIFSDGTQSGNLPINISQSGNNIKISPGLEVSGNIDILNNSFLTITNNTIKGKLSFDGSYFKMDYGLDLYNDQNGLAILMNGNPGINMTNPGDTTGGGNLKYTSNYFVMDQGLEVNGTLNVNQYDLYISNNGNHGIISFNGSNFDMNTGLDVTGNLTFNYEGCSSTIYVSTTNVGSTNSFIQLNGDGFLFNNTSAKISWGEASNAVIKYNTYGDNNLVITPGLDITGNLNVSDSLLIGSNISGSTLYIGSAYPNFLMIGGSGIIIPSDGQYVFNAGSPLAYLTFSTSSNTFVTNYGLNVNGNLTLFNGQNNGTLSISNDFVMDRGLEVNGTLNIKTGFLLIGDGILSYNTNSDGNFAMNHGLDISGELKIINGTSSAKLSFDGLNFVMGNGLDLYNETTQGAILMSGTNGIMMTIPSGNTGTLKYDNTNFVMNTTGLSITQPDFGFTQMFGIYKYSAFYSVSAYYNTFFKIPNNSSTIIMVVVWGGNYDFTKTWNISLNNTYTINNNIPYNVYAIKELACSVDGGNPTLTWDGNNQRFFFSMTIKGSANINCVVIGSNLIGGMTYEYA